MIETAIAYHPDVQFSTTRGLADRVFFLCQDGRIDEARSLLVEDAADPDLLFSNGYVQYWLASTGRGSFESAKDALTNARHLFSQQGERERELLCNVYLGLCYSRQGQASEARILIAEAAHAQSELTVFVAGLSAAVLELESENWQAAKKYLTAIQPGVERQAFSLQGRFYMQRGLAHVLAGGEKERDAAFTDYDQAIECFEQAGNFEYAARIYNNLAMLYLSVNTETAHLNIDPAISIQRRLKNYPELAQCLDTRARIFIQEGKPQKALTALNEALALLEGADHKLSVPKFLITRGRIHADLGLADDARKDFLQAADIAELNDDGDLARMAYREGIRSLGVTHPSLSVAELRTRESAEEAELFRGALKRSKGSVAEAAELIAMPRTTFISRINKHHPELLPLTRKRRSSILRK